MIARGVARAGRRAARPRLPPVRAAAAARAIRGDVRRRAPAPLPLSTVAAAAAAAAQPHAERRPRAAVDLPPTNLNIPSGVLAKVGRRLHLQENHPLRLVKERVERYFERRHPGVFRSFDDMSPVVSARANFDDLLIPADHPSRDPRDTFYFDRDTLLRAHTSAHQSELMRGGHRAFLATGDCYRRDEIDSSHYPVFHQMEGVRLWPRGELGGGGGTDRVRDDLKDSLEGMVRELFGEVETRWVDEYFPFTDPSLELEIKFRGEWMEVLGCGCVHPGVLERVGLEDHEGWAFGIGLERLAMAICDVPDIRLFWSEDERFLSQFAGGKLARFQSFSKYPPVYKDLSFWCPDAYHDNDFFAEARNTAGDMVEKVDVIDVFTHPKTGRTSRCYRITYRSLERTLTNDEVDALQFTLRDRIAAVDGVELR